MPRFEALVIPFDDSGELELSIIADSAKEARAEAQRHGDVLRVRKCFAPAAHRGLTSREREVFLSKLASLLESRVGTGEALRLLRDQFDGRTQEVASLVLQHIEAGDDLCDALERVGERDFPGPVVAMVRAGLRAGSTVTALERAVELEVELVQLREQSSRGLMSAFMGFASAVGVVLVSSYYVGPTLVDSPLIKAGNVNVDWAFVAGDALAFLMAMIALVLGGLYAVSTVGKRLAGPKADRVTRAIPIWCEMRLGREVFLGLHALGSLLQAGLPLEQSLRVASASLPVGRLRSQLEQAAYAVEQGATWAGLLEDLDAVDRAAIGGAVDRVQIATVLSRLAQQTRRRYAVRTEQFVVGLQSVSAIALTLGGGILFAVSVLPMLMASRNLL